VVILVIALIISTLIRTFGVEQFRVPTGSMEQTLYGEHDNGDGTRSSGDRIFVAKAGGYDRGDIVVFEDKQGWLSAAPAGVSTPWYKDALEFVGVLPDSSKRYLVKRLIGLPGDRVTCCDDQGLIEVNGTPLLEDYLYKNPDGSQVNPSDWEFDVTVPAGHVFVLGDHRNDSADSRYHLCSGTQQTPQAAFPAVEDIQGPVVGIAYPVSRWARFHVPATFEGVPPPGDPPDEAQVAVYPMC
jgi:signal peptidase I